MPVPSVCGPVLWSILHSLAIRAGKGISLIKCKQDEQRELQWLFSHIDSIVPCPECKKHIEDYRKKNPVPPFALDFEDWIWIFHEAVNERLGKSPGPSKEAVRSQAMDPLRRFGEYRELLRESVLKGSVMGEALREWNRHLWLLNACY